MAEITSSKPQFTSTQIELEDTFDLWRIRTNENTLFLDTFNNYYFSVMGEFNFFSVSNFNEPIPTNIVEALNQLAERVAHLESLAGAGS